MTISQKIQYLLDNKYTQENTGSYTFFYSKDRSKRFSVKDITLSWDYLQVF